MKNSLFVLTLTLMTIPFAAHAKGPAISLKEAIEIANRAVPGPIGEAELEKENGVKVYSISVHSANGEQEVLINPDTGAVLKISKDDKNESADGAGEKEE